MKECRNEGCSSTDLAKKSAVCREHHREYTREHYNLNKQYYKDKANARKALVRQTNRIKLIDYLSCHPCVDCENDDVEVLQFDHEDATIKSYDISKMLDHKWLSILAEIEKCQIRCANCHMKRTRRQFGYWTDNGPVSPQATNLSSKA